MSWAGRRRVIVLTVVGAVILAFLITVGIATFYKTPTCTDNKQNQDETGIDCGGACSYLCREEQLPPTILFTKAIQNGEGRTDVVALVENKNVAAAAKGVPYRLTLYGADQTLIQQVTGTLDLPPGSVVPVFVPGIASGKQVVAGAFLEIEDTAPHWFSLTYDPRIMPKVSTPTLSGTLDLPRVETVFINASAINLTNVRAIVFVRSTGGEIIAASSTLLPVVPAQGQATAVFTWNAPFKSKPTALQVVPVIPLP